MQWWAWMILGAVLFGAEMFAIDAQFYLVFLGLSAALVGLAEVLGIAMPDYVQWLVFAALSLISMFTFRKMLYDKIRGDVPGFKDDVTGDFVVLAEDLAPGARSRIEFRGSEWDVVNTGQSPLESGARVRIKSREGLTIYIENDQK